MSKKKTARLIQLLEEQNALLRQQRDGPPRGESWCAMVRGPCWEHSCDWYMGVTGRDPQEDKDAEVSDGKREWGCAIAWLLPVSIEGNKETRQGAAATESMRNEILKRMDRVQNAPRLVEVRPPAHGRRLVGKD